MRKILFKYLLVTFVISILVISFPLKSQATTLLSDDFTGTTINTSKWNELDPSGAGGTSGKIQQNGSLTVSDSAVSVWGATALYSVDTFSSTGLEVQALIAPVSDTILGYGDYDFQSVGTSAFMIDIQAGGTILALSWVNGSFDGITNCGTDTGTKTYKIKIVSGGFETYKNGSLICTHTTGVTINNKRAFLESSATASTFDDVLVVGTAVSTAPDAPTGVITDPGNNQVGVSWTAPANNGSAITDYKIEYKLASEPTTWTVFADGTSTSTSTTISGLTNALSYNFRVSAINAIGTGPVSATATATPVSIGNVLTDDFTGTTINTIKWNEVDSVAGGTGGDITQNGTLSVANSYIGAWGTTALVSNETFASASLEVSATIVPGSSPLIGYGDYLFGDPANKAYLLY